MLSYIGQTVRTIRKKGISISIPAEIRRITKWKPYTRFSYTADPEHHQLTLVMSAAHGIDQIALGCSQTLKIGSCTCQSAGWVAGDTISVEFNGEKIILKRIKKAIQIIKKPQDQEIIRRIHMNGHFSILPDRQMSKKNRWEVGTLFSYDIQDGKIILEESKAGTLKINEYNGRISLCATICKAAGLLKGDPLKIDYEGKKIIVRDGD